MRLLTYPLKTRDGLDLVPSTFSSFQVASGGAGVGTCPDQPGAYAMIMTGPFGSGTAQWVMPGARSKIRMGVYFAIGTGSSVTNELFRFMSGVTPVLRIGIDGASKLNISNGAGTVSLFTGTTVLAQGTWYHLQIKQDLVSSGGTFQVLINNATELSSSGDTGFGFTSMDSIFAFEPSGAKWFSALYLNDDTGPAPSNDLEGVVLMPVFPPNADSTTFTAWAKSTGTVAYVLLDELPVSAADYINSVVAGQRQAVGFPGHGLVTGTIIRSMTARWIVSSGGSGTVTPFVQMGTSNYDETARRLPINPGVLLHRVTINPQNGLWTVGDPIPFFGLLSGA